MQRRNVEVSLSYHVIVVEAHVLLLARSHSSNIVVDLVDSTDMNRGLRL